MTEDQFFSGVRANQAIIFDVSESEEERTLQGIWISQAAEAGLPIRVSNGRIVGPIILDTMDIQGSFELVSCQLLDLLSGRYATFKKWFRLELCTFSNYCGLRGARFGSAAWFRGSSFADELDLGYVSIGVDLDLDGIKCAKRAYLVGLYVTKNFHARGAVFEGVFDMALARVIGQFDANQSIFLGEVTLIDSYLGGLIFTSVRVEPARGESAVFDRMRVDSAANLAHARFDGLAAFGGIAVKGQVIFEEASFLADCLMEGATANDLICNLTSFGGPASFIGSHVFSADFNGSTFKELARFNDLNVDVTLSLVSATFHAAAIFDRVKIGQTIRVAGTRDNPIEFRGDITSFAGIKVGSQGIFEDLTVLGSVVFEGSAFGADLSFDRCRFRRVASFIGMRTDGNISFIDVQFAHCEFHGVHCGGNFGLANCGISEKADFSYLSIEGNLVYSKCTVATELILKNANVRAELSLRSTALSEALGLEMVSCGALDFYPNLVDSAKDRAPDLSKLKINAIGLRYGQLYCVWKDFVSGIVNSRLFVLDPYSQLERHLRNVGAYHWADEVYVIGRRNFRNAFPKTSIRYWWDLALEVLSGYGLKPGRTVLALLCLFAVTTALIAFIPGFAVQGADPCNSTDLGLPNVEVAMNLTARQYAVVGGDTVSGWSISGCPLLGAWLRPYSVIAILRLIGIILIPFVVASFAGVLKYVGRRE